MSRFQNSICKICNKNITFDFVKKLHEVKATLKIKTLYFKKRWNNVALAKMYKCTMKTSSKDSKPNCVHIIFNLNLNYR